MKIAHLRQIDNSNDWIIQSTEEHAQGVAELAAKFAADFNMESWGNVAGLLHDKGKETTAFQTYIRYSSGYDTSVKPVDDTSHALVGALAAAKAMNGNPVLAFIISGHHRGLYDLNELKEKLKNKLEETRSAEILLEDTDIDKDLPWKVNQKDITHVIRMLFSCLVDADYLDTERFMNPESYKERNNDYSLEPLLEKLEQYLANIKENAADTPVNHIRDLVQEYARKNSDVSPGVFEMTVPTGGGKTLSSLLWALRHAVKYGLKRVIIAIPYTSIIEQTADVLKNIFGPGNVLEHHSQVNYESNKTGEPNNYSESPIYGTNNAERLKLSSENWDSPIIVTTNVRLFESMFHYKPSKCRRLHNLSRSVIILDEVQTLPIELYNPIIHALDTLQGVFNSSVVLTSASQPVLSKPLRGSTQQTKFEGFTQQPTPIVPHDQSLWEPLRRANLTFLDKALSFDQIAGRIASHPRVLCIVNTRKIAYEIFKHLPDHNNTIHLSRMMCSAHLKKKLTEIHNLLADSSKNIRVISTQLIEAGVDVDFPIVYRQEAGLDSIIQAAGRCNREGKLSEKGETVVFSISEPGCVPTGNLAKANDARKDMDSDTDWFSDEAMEIFFHKLTRRTDTFDKYQTEKDLQMNLKFQTVAQNFKYIDNNQTAVVVNYENSMEILERFQYAPSYRLMKELSQYMVNLHEGALHKLRNRGLIEDRGGVLVIACRDAYSEEVGLMLDNDWLDEPFIL